MKTIVEFEKLVRLAIKEEQKAQDIYRNMAKKTRDPFVLAVLQGLQEEEANHERKLNGLLNSLKPAGP